MTTAQADSPLSNAARGQAVVLQMARLGDLAQTLPLLWNLSQNQFVKLICDYQVLDWAKLLPGVDELVFLNTQIWRRRCSGEFEDLSATLEYLQEDLAKVTTDVNGDFYPLNDHPVSNGLTGLVNLGRPESWLTAQLVLVRSYVKMIAAYHHLNQLHLADLWASLNPTAGFVKAPPLSLDKAGIEFAKNVLATFHRRKIRHLWAFILGSGAKNRRLEPEVYASWWAALPAAHRPAAVLVGSAAEKELAVRFQTVAKSLTPGVLDLVGCCTPAELTAVFSQMDLVIGVDTGPLHWAAASGSKVLGLYFGPAGFYDTGPYGGGHWILAPACSDYPCAPALAEQCQWKCRSAFGLNPKMSDFLTQLSVAEAPRSFPRLPDLRIYTSKSSLDGNGYVQIEGEECSSGLPPFTHLARLALGLHRGNGHAFTAAEESFPAKHLETFTRVWLAQIEQQDYSAVVPELFLRQVKQAAILRLQQALYALGVSASGQHHSKRLLSEDLITQ